MNNLKLRYRFYDLLISEWFTMSNDIPLIGRINIFQIAFPIDENLLNLCNEFHLQNLKDFLINCHLVLLL